MLCGVYTMFSLKYLPKYVFETLPMCVHGGILPNGFAH